MIQRHKRHPQLLETHRQALLEAVGACLKATIASQLHLRPDSETYRLGGRMIEAIDDLPGEITDDREVFWAKGTSR